MGCSAGSMMQLLPPILFLLLAAASADAGIGAGHQRQRFREAPQFYNAPSCAFPVLEPSANAECSPWAAAHVAMTLDVSYLRGSMAAVRSVLQHASCPQSVQFHFVASSEIDHLNSTLSSTFPYLSYRIYTFDHEAVSGLISTSIRSALDTPLNYARSYLPRLLPRSCPRRVVYLDSDVLVLDDIATLAATPLDSGAVLAAPEYCRANFKTYFTPTFWANTVLSNVFANRKPCYFNTGVMVIDVERWREGNYTEKIEEWMELQKRMRIYELGSLPPFLLEFAGRVVPVDHRWNQHGLGGDNYQGLCRKLHPGPVSLLHWSGKGKPWVRIDAGTRCPVDDLWAPYDLLQSQFDLENS